MTSDDEPIMLGEIHMNEDDGRAERRDAAANRSKILETAERLFAAHGVSNVNMADIAQAAGVGKGTLYRRFANKGELCLALLDTQMADFQNGMLARMQQMNMTGMPKLEQLEQFMDALIYFTDTHSPLLCEVQREGLLPLDNTRLQMPHFWQYMTVSALLRTAAAAGEIPPDLDTEYLADALLSPLKADLFQFQKNNRGFTLERISAGLRTLISGLRYAAPDP
ncbi:MAG: TetR/AcrR family transcriptional regulator [Anaerolineae bacterium]|nr:TetR/AcrR family transcriptional regulator [Anaerolineae bacterium]